jgi:hypothetical protein
MSSARVAIVGAGVAGAASACAFVDAGLDVTVLERRDMTRDPNRGDVLDSVSVAHLERWGAIEEIRRRQPVQMRALVFSAGGKTLGRAPLEEPMTMLNHAQRPSASPCPPPPPPAGRAQDLPGRDPRHPRDDARPGAAATDDAPARLIDEQGRRRRRRLINFRVFTTVALAPPARTLIRTRSPLRLATLVRRRGLTRSATRRVLPLPIFAARRPVAGLRLLSRPWATTRQLRPIRFGQRTLTSRRFALPATAAVLGWAGPNIAISSEVRSESRPPPSPLPVPLPVPADPMARRTTLS